MWTKKIDDDKYRMTEKRVLSGKGQGRDCLLTYIPEGKTEVTRRQGRRHKEPWMTLRKGEDTLGTERRSTRCHSMENSLRKRLQICCKADYGMMNSAIKRKFSRPMAINSKR